MRAIVKSYDTWGNAKDGFDVNDVFKKSESDVRTATIQMARKLKNEFWHPRGKYPATENSMRIGRIRVCDEYGNGNVFSVYCGPMPIGEIEFVEDVS